MSSHPSHPTPAAPVTAFLVGNRRPVAFVLLALALASFAGSVYLFARTFQSSAAKPADAADEFAKLAGERADGLLNFGTSAYLLGGFGTLTLAAVLGTAGIVTLVSLPKPTAAQREADARKALVLFGGLTGLTLTVIGFAFSVEWYRYLAEWLDTKSPPPGAYRFVLALLVFIGGAGLAFLSAQPARADERDNPLVRRLIFGMNLGLSTFLLLVLLLVANIFVTLKVPNKLDTTATGLNSFALSEPTGDYLATLDTPITVYTTITDEDALGADVHRLLDACRDRNPQFFAVKYLSRTLNKERIAELRSKYPQADFADDGLLVTAGRDEEQHSYIKTNGLITVPDGRAQGGPPRQEFVGESKLMRELLFLSDKKSKPTIYFTVGHGEIDVLPPEPGSPQPVGPRRTANTLRTTLEKNYVEMRPLRFDLANPVVPPDATILVVADPTGAFSPAEAAAVKAYLKAPTASGKGGKLVLLSGPTPTADRRGVADTGLDGVLTDYGITLGRKYILNQPVERSSYLDTLAIFSDIIDPENPLAREFGGRKRRVFILPDAREVLVNPTAKPTGRAEVLMVTRPDRPTWVESEYPVNPGRILQQMVRDRELQVAKEVEGGGERTVAAIVTEGDKGKLAVIGSGATFVDDTPGDTRHADFSASLLSVTINWLREQPPVANIAAKTYGFYTPERKLDLLRVGVLPVFMASLLTAALGVGVWIVRRK
jgi:hypothetical protein